MRRKTIKNLVTTAMVTALVLGGSTMVYAEELPVEVETEAALDEIAEAETERLSIFRRRRPKIIDIWFRRPT